MRRLPLPSLLAGLVLTSGLLLTACDFEQVIELEVPPYDSRLVLGGFPLPDSVFNLQIGRSLSALDPFDPNSDGLLITDARVALFDEGGTFLDSLRYVETVPDFGLPIGAYRSERGLRPEPGRVYTLRAEAPGLPPVEATTRISEPAQFDVRFEGFFPISDFGDRAARLVIDLDDLPGDQVYSLYIEQTYQDPGDAERRFIVPFQSGDPILRTSFSRLDVAVDIDIDVNPGAQAYSNALFRDGLFADGSRQIPVDVRLFEDGTGDSVQTTVVLSVLNEDYVLYQQTLQLQDETRDNPFAEPVRIHTNVRGGLGIFAGYTTSSVTLELE